MGIIDHNGTNGGEQAYKVEDFVLGHSRPLRVICIGAGATGLDLAYKLQCHLKYPGCACDIPARIYEYEWAPNPRWSQFYASQPEILQYLRDTAEKFDLEKFIKFSSGVVEARWHEDQGQWSIKIRDRSTGEIATDWCHFFINGGGFLNDWQWPEIAGLHSFKGSLLHSAPGLRIHQPAASMVLRIYINTAGYSRGQLTV